MEINKCQAFPSSPSKLVKFTNGVRPITHAAAAPVPDIHIVEWFGLPVWAKSADGESTVVWAEDLRAGNCSIRDRQRQGWADSFGEHRSRNDGVRDREGRMRSKCLTPSQCY
jgi:hypothetical protein